MYRIDVYNERIDGAWLIKKAEKLGIPVPAKAPVKTLPRRQKQEMTSAIAELERFFDPLTSSSITSHRKYLGAGIIFIKKTLRKLLKPLFGALINTQRIFNSKLIEWVHLQHKWDQRIERRLSTLDKIARDLNHRITEIEKTQRQSKKSEADINNSKDDQL